MPYEINKVLTLKDDPFNRSVDMKILTEVEKIVPFQVSWVEFQELKPLRGRRRFMIFRACNQRDK